MGADATTLDKLLQAIGRSPGSRLAFTDGTRRFGCGYHVTEFRRVRFEAIDCGGNQRAETETVMELLDSQSGRPMTVARFVEIARRSEAAVPGLGQAPFAIEAAPDNAGRRRHRIARIAATGAEVVLTLEEERPACRPRAARQCCAAPAVCC